MATVLHFFEHAQMKTPLIQPRRKQRDTMNTDYPIAHELFAELWSALGGDEVWLDRVRFHGDGALPTAFAVTDFAAATFATAGAAVGELLEAGGWPPSVIDVDRVMASGWFHIFPPGPSQPLSGSQRKGAWQPPAIFADGGRWLTDFETADGRWLRVQGVFPTGRKRLAKLTPAEAPNAIAPGRGPAKVPHARESTGGRKEDPNER